MTNPAETYESYMVPTLFSPWARELVAAAHPAPGERALDVGCGTGAVTRELAPAVQPGGSVAGIDPSPGMLAVAREVCSGADCSVELHEGRAEALPFEDNSFDLVTSQFALMFFDDRAAAAREMHRVLRGGGRVALSVWQGIEEHPFYHTLDRVIEAKLGHSAVNAIFVLGDASETCDLLSAAGFHDVAVESRSKVANFGDPADFLAGEIDVDTAAIPAMQQLNDAERQEIVTAISAEMEEPLRSVTQDGQVMLPFHAHLFTARK